MKILEVMEVIKMIEDGRPAVCLNCTMAARDEIAKWCEENLQNRYGFAGTKIFFLEEKDVSLFAFRWGDIIVSGN